MLKSLSSALSNFLCLASNLESLVCSTRLAAECGLKSFARGWTRTGGGAVSIGPASAATLEIRTLARIDVARRIRMELLVWCG
jgi:hypothetical protein